MTTQKENPAGGPGFRDYRGDGSFPQQNHEAFSQNCQEKSDMVRLVADLLDKHLALRAELAALRAENARLRELAGGCAL